MVDVGIGGQMMYVIHRSIVTKVITFLLVYNYVYFQAKEWGFRLRSLFGYRLGTGDYAHIVIEHASMLLRQFRSLKQYSNQGFEAAHKIQRQLYSRTTSHDGNGNASSCK